jgi:bifunctional non-homologous end joining protein LigD
MEAQTKLIEHGSGTYLNGYDLRKLPLFERKALLKRIIVETDIQFSESVEVDGREMYKHACTGEA